MENICCGDGIKWSIYQLMYAYIYILYYSMHDIQLQRFFEKNGVTNHLAILELKGSFTGKPKTFGCQVPVGVWSMFL